MSRHSKGQHIRKLHKIVSVADGKLSQARSAEESPPNSGRQSAGQGEETDKRSHQIHASNGIKAENLEIRGSKQEKGHFVSVDQYVAESSTDRDTNTHCHEGVGNNIERLKEVAKRRLLKPSKARISKSLNTGLRISNSVNDLPSYTLTSGPADSQCRGSNPERQCHAYTETKENNHGCCGVNQTDHLIEELEDTREQLKRSLEDNARLRTEVNHLAGELYKFKIHQMVEQNGAMTLGTGLEIPASTHGLGLMVHGTGQILNRTSEPDLKDGNAHFEHNEISIMRSRDTLEGQLKILQDYINKLEQFMEIHKSECQTTTVAQPSEFNTSVMKVLCEMTSLQKAIQENSRDFFAKTQVALKSKSVENDQLRRVVLEYKTEVDTLVQQMNATMEEEWSQLQEKQDQLEVERERLSKKPIMELKTQIIQLRGGYEQKITKLQEETKKLEEHNAALEHKYSDLRDKIDVKPEQATAEQPSSDDTEHAIEMRSPGNREGRTTHLERVVNELQTMVANNEQLWKKGQQSLQSRTLPPTGRERASSPSPVAVVTPISQSENSKPQLSYLQQANVEPIVKNVSPPLPHGSEQQRIHFMEGETIREDTELADNPQTMTENIVAERGRFEDRPFDPNLVCLGCGRQFRIGEIQEYKKHYADCLSRQQLDPVPVG